MIDTFLPFSKPIISEEEIEAVASVLRSGWITTGPNCGKFENEFAAYVGCEHAIALTSATAGMHIALKALGIGPGDEVITPSLTWVSTINLITLSGATPVFVDIDKDNLMITADGIETAITEKTKLIIPVHYAGAPADLDAIYNTTDLHNIAVIEDAAHATGTQYKGKSIGSRGTSIFSFHPIKNMTTGEGGMFCTNNSDLADCVRRLKFHGLGVDAFDRRIQGRSPQAEVLEPGYKYNMTDISAILGRSQLKRLDEFNKKRGNLAKHYLKTLKNVEGITPLVPPSYNHYHAWDLFIVRIDEKFFGMNRNEFMVTLKEHNIGTGIHFLAVHNQKYYRDNIQVTPNSLNNTEWNSERICSLPLFPDMTLSDVDYVCSTIHSIWDKKIS
jgi:UDP-4-amino-4-deoxy-L-arabinose-oxoglutarate aminotransferase